MAALCATVIVEAMIGICCFQQDRFHLTSALVVHLTDLYRQSSVITNLSSFSSGPEVIFSPLSNSPSSHCKPWIKWSVAASV